jgi:oligopeptide transport system ATP-binding protein
MLASHADTLVNVKGISKLFDVGRNRKLHAVDDVSIEIQEGETLGLVGESGCGKSTLGRLLVRMYEQTGGSYDFAGVRIGNSRSGKERKAFARQVQMIFQDPYGSLNPRMTVGDIVAEGPDIHGLWKPEERTKQINYWLERVGLLPEHAFRFPHEFSGGQRQRIGIARALAVRPKFIVCDEPISALDVSVQAQIVNLLQDLQKEFKLTYLFIAHGLNMVRHISNRMAVMYLGRVVETGPADDVYYEPLHPYTQALLKANPSMDPDSRANLQDNLLQGEIASPVNPKPGCRFAARCERATAICREVTPELREVAPMRQVACHLA